MKKIITYSLASLFAMSAFAQVEKLGREDNIDWKEDSIEIRTINDIIAQQQEATTVNSSEQHFKEVWGRRSYRNLSINLPYSLDPQNVETGVSYNGGLAPKYKSQLSLTYSTGRSYRVHKNAIGNVLQIYIDYTPFDLTISHYKIETKENAYDSRAFWSDTIFKRDGKTIEKVNQYKYTTWNLEKYQLDYGMLLGPSITVAPFTHLDEAPGLHHLKLNLYAHFGYRASLLYMVNSETADANPTENNDFNEMKDNAKLDWGHGFYWSWGFSLTWKGIGLGYEHNTGNLKYKPIDTGTFGNRSYKFNTINNRLYISFRVGK